MRLPNELEDDLLAHRNLDIGLWHRLTINPLTGVPYLDSRRLLVIAEGLPDEGRFKTALRGGRQPRRERVQEHLYNEMALLRASYVAVNGGEEASYEPTLLRDPIDELERIEKAAAESVETDQAVEEFEAEAFAGHDD